MKLRRSPHLRLGIVCATALLLGATPPPGQESAPDAMGGEELLARSIDYHDPRGRWLHSSWRLELLGTRPLAGATETTIILDHVDGRYHQERRRDGRLIEATVTGDECWVRVDGSSELEPEQIEEYRLTCPTLRSTRDAHAYLYGLPMKLRDEGARIAPEAHRDRFAGRDVWSLRVTYDPEIGGDTWYFYFDPESHALVGYRFYHDETAGDGEYVVLDREVQGDGLRLPKVRTWYTNAEGRLLGTDTIRSLERLSGRP